jgi:hypothetical protein
MPGFLHLLPSHPLFKKIRVSLDLRVLIQTIRM